MKNQQLPSISVLMPTLNAAKVLDLCLKSIAEQDYSKEKIEIIVADGGSTDRTLEIAKKYTNKIYPNPLKTGEAGKAVALKHAKNDVVALIDSDNILPQKDWFLRMVEPFSDPEIIGSEPIEYTYRKEDGFITRYCALLGMNDPLCLFLKNYDRKNYLTGKWTGLKLKEQDRGGWIKVLLKPPQIPTIGANGTVLRRKILAESELVGDYLFDIDVISYLASRKPVKFAKVKIGIVHLYCGSSIKTFFRKQNRRVRDYLYYAKLGLRQYTWGSLARGGLLKYILYSILIFPLIFQSCKGFLRKQDLAWFFHPLACWITLLVYGKGKIEGFFKLKIQERTKWGQ